MVKRRIPALVLVLASLQFGAGCERLAAGLPEAPPTVRVQSRATSDSLKPVPLFVADDRLTLAGVDVSLDDLPAKLEAIPDKAHLFLDLEDEASPSRGSGMIISRIEEIAYRFGSGGFRHNHPSVGWTSYSALCKAGVRIPVPPPMEATRAKTQGVDWIEFDQADGARVRLRGRTATLPSSRWQYLQVCVFDASGQFAQDAVHLGSGKTSDATTFPALHEFEIELNLRKLPKTAQGAMPTRFSITIGQRDPNEGLDEMAESVLEMGADAKQEEPGETTLGGKAVAVIKTSNQILRIRADKIQIFDEQDGRKHLACGGNVNLEVLDSFSKN